MRLLNASDHRWLSIETDSNPLQIGALIFLACDGLPADEFVERAKAHLAARLPLTPWSVRYKASPFHIDSGAWLQIGDVNIDRITSTWQGSAPITMAELSKYACEQVLLRLPRDRPLMRITFFDNLSPELRMFGDVAMMVQHHHALADGVGFQNAINAVTDPSPNASKDTATRPKREHAPLAPVWMAQAMLRARKARLEDGTHEVQRAEARAALEQLRSDPEYKRQRTPEIPGFEGETPRDRVFGFTAFDLPFIKERARELGGTVNDLIMTMVGGAARLHLQSIGVLDDLGDRSLIGLMPRSFRTPADGEYGNYFTMVLPVLGTHIADHHERFRVVQKSIRAELRRSQLMQESTSQYEKPFAARKRLGPETGTSAGNLSISNVPGPDATRWFAGYRMVSNYPTPSLAPGQLVNLTLRRYCNEIHLGMMSEPTKIADLAPFTAQLHQVLEEI